jgi:hypothetical protein
MMLPCHLDTLPGNTAESLKVGSIMGGDEAIDDAILRAQGHTAAILYTF